MAANSKFLLSIQIYPSNLVFKLIIQKIFTLNLFSEAYFNVYKGILTWQPLIYEWDL